jgi:hypothetical protein
VFISAPSQENFRLIILSWQYYGREEKRPGGRTSTAEIRPKVPSILETYHLIGDEQSVRAVLIAVMSNCSVQWQDAKRTVATFNRDSTNKTVWPERVVQYYRASTFALSLDTYNNTASLPVNQPKDNNTAPPVLADTPLPGGLSTAFLACLNATIAFSVPLIEVDTRKQLNNAETAGVALGCIFGAGFFMLSMYYVVICICNATNRRDVARGLLRHDANTIHRSWVLPFVLVGRKFGFGREKDKADGKETRGRYSSLGKPDSGSLPESHNLAVTQKEATPAFK